MLDLILESPENNLFIGVNAEDLFSVNNRPLLDCYDLVEECYGSRKIEDMEHDGAFFSIKLFDEQVDESRWYYLGGSRFAMLFFDRANSIFVEIGKDDLLCLRRGMALDFIDCGDRNAIRSGKVLDICHYDGCFAIKIADSYLECVRILQKWDTRTKIEDGESVFRYHDLNNDGEVRIARCEIRDLSAFLEFFDCDDQRYHWGVIRHHSGVFRKPRGFGYEWLCDKIEINDLDSGKDRILSRLGAA